MPDTVIGPNGDLIQTYDGPPPVIPASLPLKPKQKAYDPFAGSKPFSGNTGGHKDPYGSFDFGAPAEVSYENALAAYLEKMGEVSGIFGKSIGPDSGRFGVLGNVLTRMLSNPEGFDAKTRQAVMTRLAEREAGTRTDQQRRGTQMAGSSGFRGNQVGVEQMLQELRGESSSRLSSAELDFEMQNQQLRQANLQSALSAALQAAGIDASLIGQQADITARAQKPLPLGDTSELPTNFGDVKNRLPGETLAEQIRREAAARAAAQGGSGTGAIYG